MPEERERTLALQEELEGKPYPKGDPTLAWEKEDLIAYAEDNNIDINLDAAKERIYKSIIDKLFKKEQSFKEYLDKRVKKTNQTQKAEGF